MLIVISASLVASAEALEGERILKKKDDLIGLFVSLLKSQIEVSLTSCLVARMMLQVTVVAVARTVDAEEVKSS